MECLSVLSLDSSDCCFGNEGGKILKPSCILKYSTFSFNESMAPDKKPDPKTPILEPLAQVPAASPHNHGNETFPPSPTLSPKHMPPFQTNKSHLGGKAFLLNHTCINYSN